MAFVGTAFTLSQIADVEKRAAREQDQAFLTEYRFVHSKLPAILAGNTGRTTDNLSFNATFSTTVATFRTTLGAKGYDAAIYLAGNASAAPRSECMYLATPCPPSPTGAKWASTVPLGGTEPFDSRLDYDRVSDGLVWMCDSQVGALVGAVVHLYLADGRSSISETVVIALNHEWYKSEVARGADKCKP